MKYKHLGLIERGLVARPGDTILAALAGVYQVDLEDLLERLESESPPAG